MTIIADKINYLWLDTETTGLDPTLNDVIQLACIAVVNGNEYPQTFNEFCQPFDYKTVDDKALEINHVSMAQLKTFQQPTQMVENFVRFAKQFNVKFTIAGYNADFDKNFISSLFRKAGRDKDFNAIFNSDIRDVYKRVKVLKDKIPTQNLKLGTLCQHFGITIKAHDALSDISATIKLDKIVSEMLGDIEVYDSIVDHKVDSSLSLREPVQLHMHSKYSYLDSVNSIEEIAEWCIKNNVKGFACADHTMAASLYDVIRMPDVIKSINKENKTEYPIDAVTAIPAFGLYVSDGDHKFHLNAWAINNEGYSNLIKLASDGWKYKIEVSDVELPIVPLEQVFQNSSGLVFGVPGINGPATAFIIKKQMKELEELIVKLSSKLDIRLELAALDVFKYFDSSIGFMSYPVKEGNMQKMINKIFYLLHKKHNIKLVPVSDSHFLNPNDKILQDCVSKNSFKDHRYFFESRHQLTSNEMYTILKAHIGSEFTTEFYESLVDNTYEILEASKSIKVKHEFHLPKVLVPEHIAKQTSDYNEQTKLILMEKIKEHGRWIDAPQYIERFHKELDVIMYNTTLNFMPYFLMYEDICAYVRSKNLMQNLARGSAGGSLLSYYLKIIHIDPVATNLPFERFLSHARIRAGSFPDIDLDLADEARPHVIKYLQDKYGSGFAQISTFNKMKTKNAIKDAMYALYGRNRNDPEVKVVCNSIPDSPQGVDEWDFLYGYTDQEGVDHKGQVQENQILANFFTQRPEIEDMVKKMIGFIRGWSRHASAFIISTLDLPNERLPTMVMTDQHVGDIRVSQYNGAMVEKTGLVKADILGIKTLTMASDCIELIKKNHGINFLEEDKGVPLIYRLPDKDKGVFSDFYKKNTDSSFQFNTPLIKGYAKEFAPLSKADLAAMTALCRPGALDAPLGFNAVVVVEYEDGSTQEFPKEEYEKWLKRLTQQL